LNRYPLESIVIHPRTGIQMYKGAPDLDTFSACTDLLAADVVYNGDIFQLDDFRALSSRFPGIRRWMLGRGVLGNPMLPEEIQGRRSSRGEATDRFRRFHDDLVTAYADRLSGPGHLLGKMKGFWTYFAFFFPQSQTIARRLHHAREWNRFLEITQAVFQNGEGFEDSRGPGLPASGGVQV
jgi:tRNA-dihydrouridine synthase B